LKVGRIEIVFTRVVLGDVIPSQRLSRDGHDYDDAQATLKRPIGKDVAHTTG
jgi:hypothetical protein